MVATALTGCCCAAATATIENVKTGTTHPIRRFSVRLVTSKEITLATARIMNQPIPRNAPACEKIWALERQEPLHPKVQRLWTESSELRERAGEPARSTPALEVELRAESQQSGTKNRVWSPPCGAVRPVFADDGTRIRHVIDVELPGDPRFAHGELLAEAKVD